MQFRVSETPSRLLFPAQRRLWRLLTLVLLTSIALLTPLWSRAQDPVSAPAVSLDILLDATAHLNAPGPRITALSAFFVGAPYRANTLLGGPGQTEQLVTRLDGFDCFTFLDTVEALRRSRHASDFPDQLRQVRYREGRIDYLARRHFFSDWVADRSGPVRDVTAEVGRDKARTVVKELNRKADGSLWLPGLAVTVRPVTYLPSEAIDAELLGRLQPGDYVGFFSEQNGLDVQHTGLLVVTGTAIMLRHASSRRGTERIVDEDLVTYLHGQTGLVVYRVPQ